MRRLTYVTGTRADFGLMLPTLRTVAATPGLDLSLVVTGMHLSDAYGRTEQEVEASGLPILTRIPLPVDIDSGAGMAACAGELATAMANLLPAHAPHALILLGDRWEMLAAGMSALLCSVPILHLCGGERSGTVDESMRHALSKLAHLHGVANHDARERLIGMGEEPWRVHQVGTPGLVGIADDASTSAETLAARYGIDCARPYALVLFHPVVQDAEVGGIPVALTLQELARRGMPALCLQPNADHGTGNIRRALDEAARAGIKVVTHMPRHDFLSALRDAAVLIGNSSSGIIEAASFGTPVVNVGDRQQGRARNANVIDAEPTAGSIARALDAAAIMPRNADGNIYGDGTADRQLAELLSGGLLDDPRLLKKQMTY